MALFSRFFGRTVGEGAGVAIGTATANVVEPALQELANAARAQYPHLPIDPETAAELRARETTGEVAGIDLGGVDPVHEAAYGGVRRARFDVLTELARSFPGVGELLRLRRRAAVEGEAAGINRTQFRRALRHGGLEADYIDAITNLIYERLSPEDVANAVQQGFLKNDGLLPPPESGGPPFEPPVEQVDLDPSDEAFTSGIERERLRVLAQLSGNPPGPETLLELWNRGAITEAAVDRGIREGRTKTKWTPAIKQLAIRLLSPATLVNLYLRGWIDQQTYFDRMERHGYTNARANDWYLSAGRPAAPVQMQTAWARGIDGPDGRPMDEAQFKKGIRESDIRPEWGEMLWGIRYAYPSIMQLRRAVESGGIGRERALTILRYGRYESQDAIALVDSWLRGTGTTAKGLTASELTAEYEGLYVTRAEYVAELQTLGYSAETAAARADAADSRRVKTYRDAAIRAVHKRYILHRADNPEARQALIELALPAEAIDHMLGLWAVEREEKAAVLTPAQVKKAFKAEIFDRARALAELEARGYDVEDANVLLDE